LDRNILITAAALNALWMRSCMPTFNPRTVQPSPERFFIITLIILFTS
jgi:hypothetical protein